MEEVEQRFQAADTANVVAAGVGAWSTKSGKKNTTSHAVNVVQLGQSHAVLVAEQVMSHAKFAMGGSDCFNLQNTLGTLGT
jgi:hypothetical protein